MGLIEDIFTVAEKELLLSFRFKLKPLVESFLSPLAKIIPILLVYYGFLHFSSAENLGGITKENYVLFLNIGMFLSTLFLTGLLAFGAKFYNEKYWKTLDAIFLSPIRNISLIIGVGLAEFILAIPAMAFFFILAFSVYPINIFKVIAILFVVCLVYLICLSVGLIHGSMIVTREGKTFITNYFFTVWSFLSCFTYPLTIIPKNFLGFIDIQLIVKLNPVYQGLQFVNQLWIHGEFLTNSLIYVMAFAIAMPIISGYFFRKSWKTLGVEGY